MTINKLEAISAEQPPDDGCHPTVVSSTNIILKPLDVDSVVRLIES